MKRLILLGLLLSGCANDCDPIQGVFDPSGASERTQAAFQWAAAKWCNEAGQCAVLQVGAANKLVDIENIKSTTQFTVAALVREIDTNQETLYVEPAQIEDHEINSIMLHELGHVWGCPDYKIHPERIMFWQYTGNEILSPADIACATPNNLTSP